MELGLKDVKWKEFDLNEIFPEIKRGKRLKKDDHIIGKAPYVSSTSSNNGIDGFIGNEDSVRIFSNCLTLANSGSVGSTFYHPYSFVASDHVTKLKNGKLNKYVYLFISVLTNRFSEKYSYNREINSRRIRREKIILPTTSEGEPNYAFMEGYMRKVEKQKIKKYKTYIENRLTELVDFIEVEPLNEKEWIEFELDEIFTIESGKRLTRANMDSGKKPFIGATDSNNGITEFVSNTNKSEDSNVLGVNYNGSVVENFYHPYKALFTDDVKRLSFKNREGNKHLFLFVKAQILKQRVKYQYGYKFNSKRMKKQKIMLPTTDSQEPDYNYMENYMKHIEYRKLKHYLEQLN